MMISEQFTDCFYLFIYNLYFISEYTVCNFPNVSDVAMHDQCVNIMFMNIVQMTDEEKERADLK